MNVKKVTSQLKRKYPGKKIILNHKTNPTEIICEIEPTQDHPDYSLAIAVIDKSNFHVHHQSTEEYKVIKGILTILKNNKKFNLKKGDQLTINPGETHWAKGKETWVECLSRPGWTAKDHFAVKD